MVRNKNKQRKELMLKDMDKNYDKGLQAIHDVLNSMKFRHLSILGKLTVIKTLCSQKLTIKTQSNKVSAQRG